MGKSALIAVIVVNQGGGRLIMSEYRLEGLCNHCGGLMSIDHQCDCEKEIKQLQAEKADLERLIVEMHNLITNACVRLKTPDMGGKHIHRAVEFLKQAQDIANPNNEAINLAVDQEIEKIRVAKEKETVDIIKRREVEGE
jgi:hypothetical protein